MSARVALRRLLAASAALGAVAAALHASRMPGMPGVSGALAAPASVPTPQVPAPAPAAPSAQPAAPTPAPVVALVPDLVDVRRSVLLGPSAQVYAPDPAPSAPRWLRRSAGGVASNVRGAALLDGELIAAGAQTPLYRRRGEQWTLAQLGQRGRVVLGTGPVFSIAIGKQIFVHSAGKVVRVGAAPGAVTALWAASDKLVFLAGEQGVLRRRGAAFVPVPQTEGTLGFSGAAPHAITAQAAVNLRSGLRVRLPGTAVLAVPSPVEPAAVVTLPSGKLALTQQLTSGAVAELPGPALPLAAAVDGAGRALLALPDGVHLLEGSTWTSGALADELPAARPGPPPARSR